VGEGFDRQIKAVRDALAPQVKDLTLARDAEIQSININGDVKDPAAFATMVVDRAEKKLLPLVRDDAHGGKLGSSSLGAAARGKWR
jgi:hypothetical protein